MNRQTRVKNKQESGNFYRVQWDKKSKYCCHPPFHPPYFLSPFFKIFVTHPPKINDLDTVVTATPVLRPDIPQNLECALVEKR